MASGQGQFASWGVGTSVAASFGIVTGGEVGPPNSPINHRRGIYAQARMTGAMLEYTGSVEFLPTGTNDATLIGYALRSGFTDPSLTALAIEGGHVGEHSWLHTGCYIATLELSQSVNEALSASITWQGTDGSRDDSPTAQAAETARAAGVKALMLTHISNRYDDPSVLEEEAKQIFGSTRAVRDLDMFTVSAKGVRSV